jgi:hypothetical protein
MNRITKALSTVGVAALFAAGSLVVAGPAHADSDGTFTYSIEDNVASISAYTGPGGAVVIPETLGGANVGGILGHSFNDKGLTSVTIPQFVTFIQSYAFQPNALLTRVIFQGQAAPSMTSGGQDHSSFDNIFATLYYPLGGTGYTSLNYAIEELPPAPYDETEADISATVNAGLRSASLAEVSFAAATVSHNDQDVVTESALSVNDLSGTAAGWQVTLEASDLVFTAGPDSHIENDAIDASNVFVKGKDFAGATDTTSSVTGVTLASSTLTALGSPYVVLSALDAQGEGAYVANLTFSLNIPANSRNGGYSGTITTTMSVAPVVP